MTPLFLVLPNVSSSSRVLPSIVWNVVESQEGSWILLESQLDATDVSVQKWVVHYREALNHTKLRLLIINLV